MFWSYSTGEKLDACWHFFKFLLLLCRLIFLATSDILDFCRIFISLRSVRNALIILRLAGVYGKNVKLFYGIYFEKKRKRYIFKAVRRIYYKI